MQAACIRVYRIKGEHLKASIKAILVLLLCLPAASMAGTNTPGQMVHTNPRITFGGEPIQGASPDPLLTVLIGDDYSHTAPLTGRIWYELAYNGSGTCYVRLMNTTTKASYPKEAVSNGSTHSYVVHPNTAYLNYSGCNSGASSNSILHLQ